MYAVVGCSNCEHLWLVEGSPETSQCPRCGRTREHASRRRFVTTDDPDHARDVRAALLATRQEADGGVEGASFTSLADDAEAAGLSERAVLEAAGIDPDAVFADDEHEAGGGPTDRRAVIRAAIRHLDEPTDAAVREFAVERDVSATFVDRALERLVRSGEATRDGDTYRLLER